MSAAVAGKHIMKLCAYAIAAAMALCGSFRASPAGGVTGSWKVYEAFAAPPQQVVATDRMVYILSGGSLFGYDTDKEETVPFTATSGLHGHDISRIFYDPAQKCLAVCYKNGGIDLMASDGKVKYVPDIADSQLSGPFTFNDAAFRGKEMFLATDFGIVKVDIGRGRVVKYGNYGCNVSGVALMDGNLFMAAGDTLRVIPEDGRIDRLSFTRALLPVGAARLRHAGGDSLMVMGDCLRITRINPDAFGAGELTAVSAPGIKQWMADGEELFYCDSERLYHFNSVSGKEDTMCMLPEEIKGDMLEIRPSDDTLWALSRHGVAGYKVDDNGTVRMVKERFRPSEMSVDEVCYLTPSADGKRLYAINHGPTSFRFGFPEGYNGYDIPGKAACIDIETDRIKDITPYPVYAACDMTAGLQQSYGPYPFAVTSIAENPADTSIVFIGTGNDGLYMTRSGKFAGRYTSSNSPLKPVWGWIVYSLAFDKGGNLWVVSNHDNYTDKALMVLPKEKTLLDPEEVKASDWIVPAAEGYLGDMDSKILVCRRSPMVFITDKLKSQILLACHTAGTPDDITDDRFRLYDCLADQDGRLLSDCVVSAIMEDTDGSVWLGTLENGIYRIENPAAAVEKEVTARHLKVPRDDGSGLADYLLADEVINDMSVDAARRKWIATENSGVYVVSADGSAILEHFTPDNSPLPAMAVNCVYADPSGRNIYIGTPRGLVRFESDTAPDSGELTELKIYPNPVKPESQGTVHIDGLTDGALVKIVSVSGAVVARGRAEGGTFVWNMASRRPPAGVYYVMASTAGDAALGKIVVIN